MTKIIKGSQIDNQYRQQDQAYRRIVRARDLKEIRSNSIFHAPKHLAMGRPAQSAAGQP